MAAVTLAALALTSAPFAMPGTAEADDGTVEPTTKAENAVPYKASGTWPQFRGTSRSGVVEGVSLADAWPDNGPRELWRRPIGPGFSEVVVAAGCLYTQFSEGAPPPEEEEESGTKLEAGEPAQEFIGSFDARTGKELWRRALGPTFFNEFGDGPRSTPTLDNGSLFALGSYGDLYSLDADTGEVNWHVSLAETFAAQAPRWGFSTSVLVDGDLVLVESGGAEGKAVAGLDRATGATRWHFGDAPEEHSYSSAIAVELDGVDQFVLTAAGQAQGIDRQGTVLWSHPWPSAWLTYTLPVFVPPNRFFLSAMAGQEDSALIEIRKAPKGSDETGQEAWEVEQIWTSRQLRNHFSSSVYYEGYLFGFHNATFRVLSAGDGSMAWARRGFGKGSLIIADGKLLILSDQGKLVMASASGEAYEELGRIDAMDGKSWTAPTLAGSRLYLRNLEEMVAYELAPIAGAATGAAR